MNDTKRLRCVNIDWLEVFCLEPVEGRGAEYFRSIGYYVVEREYGTRHMESVFTIYDDHCNPFMEVRRQPRKGESGKHTIYPDGSCNLRLVNRYCYFEECARIMQEFIDRFGYEFRRIYRLDLCIDFIRFDSGDYPRKVLQRIVNHKYAKVYQARRRVCGTDRWDGADDNYISWGNPNSMVVTRFYNKTLELKEVHDKEWIRQAWFEAGLVTDPTTLLTPDRDGGLVDAEVWRLEFQINSTAREWFAIDGDNGKEWVEHTLQAYYTRQQIQLAIANLVSHYFQFRVYKEGIRKYDCPEKKLFEFSEIDEHYRLSNVALDTTQSGYRLGIVRTLQRIRTKLVDAEMLDCVDRLIKHFESRDRRSMEFLGTSPKMLQLLMSLNSQRAENLTYSQVSDMLL